MNWIETVICVILLLIVIMTFITEPLLSARYYKAFSKSGIVVFKKTVTFVNNFVGKNKTIEINETGLGDD